MSITPHNPANFTPSLGSYNELKPFRYWCQKVLPLVYDDSLSYYEVLCKVVDYLNKTMEDVGTLHDDVVALHTAYEQLQSYVNNYFSTLDVQEEINNKLDTMASDGTLDALLLPYFEEYEREINATVTTQNNKITVLEGRMDTFASLTEGSTTGDAELQDIRVGYNGTTYTTAGNAVRAQVSDLHDEVDDINDAIYDTKNHVVSTSVLRHNTNCRLLDDGTLLTGSNNDAYVSDFISIDGYYISNILCAFNSSESAQVPICFYSSNTEESFIGYSRQYDELVVQTWASVTTPPTIPDGTHYIRIAGRNSIVSGSPALTLSEDVLITDEKLDKDVFDNFYDLYGKLSNSKNIVGMENDVYYPCYVKKGDKITMSTNDGEAVVANYPLWFYDKDKNQLGYYNFISGQTERTVTLNFTEDVYYIKWGATPVLPTTQKFQVEYGDTKTSYVDYVGNAKKNYEELQKLTVNNIFTRCKEQILNIRNASGLNRGEYGKHDFNLLITTDLHNDVKRMKNAYNLASGDNLIDGIVNLGDTWGAQPNISPGSTSLADYIPIINSVSDKPALTVLGNHDQRVYENTDVTTEQVTDAFLRETNNGSIYEDGGYGYYDFEEYKIRLIILNSYDMPDTKDGDDYIYYGSEVMYRQDQMDWLCATLKSVPANYSVIIALHYAEPATLDTDVIDPHFGFVGGSYGVNTVFGSKGRMSDTIVSDIVDAYINRTTLTKNYTYSMNGSAPGSVTINENFSSSNGTFICYISGHTHCHAIGHIANHTDQVVYFADASRATINDSSWTTVSDMFSRDTETQNQDSLVCLSVNTDNKLLRFVKIGAHIDVFGDDYNIVKYTYDD